MKSLFPAPLVSTIEELIAFLTHEGNAAHGTTAPSAPGIGQANGVTALAVNGEAPRK